MAVYYILLIATTAIGIPLCRIKNRSNLLIKIYLGIAFLVLFIPAAIRNISGYDYNLYATWYNDLISMDYSTVMAWSREKGFIVPLKILTVLTTEWQPMFIIISLVIAIGIILYVYKNSSCAYISIAAFFSLGLYYNSLNFMRQFIAAIIVSFALNYIDSKQPLRFFALVLFASCFHFSALLLIPFYFILKIKLNIVTLGIYSAITALTFIFSVPIIKFVTEYFYKSYNPMTSIHMLEGLPVRYTIIFGVLFIPIYIFKKELIEKRSLNKILINAYIFVLIFEIIGIKHSIISRFSLLFVIAPVLVLAPDLILIILEKIKVKFKRRQERAKLISIITVAAFCLYGLIVNTVFLLNNYNGVVPYMTVFDKQEIGD